MIPKTLYRFFSNEQYANDFINGKIRLSTLKSCTEIEIHKGGDDLEGKMKIHIDNHVFQVSSDTDKKLLQNATVVIRKSSPESKMQIRMVNCTTNYKIDANVLCFTKEPSEYILKTFGQFGVQLNNPEIFLERVHKCLKESDPNYLGYRFNHVHYNDNSANYLDMDALDQLGFSKRKEIFEMENEFRFLFGSKALMEVKFINIGSISDIASLVNFQ